MIPLKCATMHKDMDAPVTVYNVEVDGNHDYFVGPDAVLCNSDR